MYADYPISPTLFHWESQSTTSVASPDRPAIRDGIEHRAAFSCAKDSPRNLGRAPYLFLGPVQYAYTQGDRPIAITWQLEHPMPAEFFTAAATIAQ